MSYYKPRVAVHCVAVLSYAVPLFSADLTLSGIVVDTDSNPLSGVVVSLAQNGASTTTDAAGTWKLSSISTGIKSHFPSHPQIISNQLFFENGKINVRFNGSDITGRFQGIMPNEPMRSKVVARAIGIQDTLQFITGGKVRLRDTVSASVTGIVRKIDTTFNPSIIYGYLTDTRDGQVYKTVKIGPQVWMAENLNGSNSGAIGRCYNDSPDSCAKYGRMYIWQEAMNGESSSSTSPSGVKGICPQGWHLPSNSEWVKLADSTLKSDSVAFRLRSKFAWVSNYYDKDTYGFHALPGGIVGGETFSFTGSYGAWWSSTTADNTYAYYSCMHSGQPRLDQYTTTKKNGIYIRCIQD